MTRNQTKLQNNPSTPTKGISSTGAILGMVNTMIGAGLISIPYSFANVGIPFGFLIGLTCIALSIFSLHLVGILAKDLTGRQTSFYQACSVYFPKGKYIVDLLIIAQGFGSSVAYLILIRDTMPMILGHSVPAWLQNGKYWITFILCFITYPLSMLRSLRSLRYSSYLAIVVILYLTCLVVSFSVMRFLDEDSMVDLAGNLELVHAPSSVDGVIRCLSYMVFAFTCQQNMFKIYNELEEPRSVKRITLISGVATILAGVVYFLFGVLGYLTLGSATKPDLLGSYSLVENRFHFNQILDSYDPNHVSLMVGRVALVLLVTTCFPLQMHPCRDSMIQFITCAFKSVRVPSIMMPLVRINQRTDGGLLHSFCATILCFLSLILALTVKELGTVFLLVGGVGSNAIAYLLPALLYMLYDQRPIIRTPKKAFAALLFAFGVVMFIGTFYSAFN